MIDSHAHLTYKGLREEMDAVVGRARDAGLTGIVTVGVNVADSFEAVKAAGKYGDVWAVIGVHPHDVEKLKQSDIDRLAGLAKEEKVVGWGETGLDFFRDYAPRDLQRKWFRAQAAAARELGLPLVIHDRDAHAEVLEVVKEEAKRGLRGVVHCFSGDKAFALEVLKTGFLISIPGTVTYPKNQMLKDVVAAVPLEKCLIETDCPFLSPQPVRSQKNEPAFVRYAAEEVARIKGLSVADVGRITARAATELFGLGGLGDSRIAYPIRRSLYLNVTDRCTNSCAFCAKNKDTVVKGHELKLAREPGEEEILAAVDSYGGPAAWDEVVFCGLGEPLLRLGVVVNVARALKAKGAKRVRVNTDGLSDLVHGVDTSELLAGLVDAVSVSLNAADEETYKKLCRPSVPGSYGAVKDFLKRAGGVFPDVTASVVAVPGLDIEACRKTAANLGVKFRVRPFDEVG